MASVGRSTPARAGTGKPTPDMKRTVGIEAGSEVAPWKAAAGLEKASFERSQSSFGPAGAAAVAGAFTPYSSVSSLRSTAGTVETLLSQETLEKLRRTPQLMERAKPAHLANSTSGKPPATAAATSTPSSSGTARTPGRRRPTTQGALHSRSAATLSATPSRTVWALRDRVQAACAAVDQAIIDAQAESDAVVAAAAARLNAEADAFAAEAAAEAAREAGIAEMMRQIAERNEALAEMRTRRDVLRLDLDERLPYWLIRLTAITQWVTGSSYGHAWRPDFLVMLRELIDIFERDDKPDMVPLLHDITAHVNAWPPAKFKQALENIKALSHALELKRESSYTIAHRRLAACEAEIAELTKQLDADMAAQLRDTNHFKTVAFETRNSNVETAIGARVSNDMRLSGSGVPGARPESIGPSVERYVNLVNMREPPTKMKSSFHEFLVHCAHSGAWEDAFQVYGGMLRCRVVPDENTFQLMIAAAKHAKPPNSAAAATVLAEMRRRGMVIPATMFNRVIDACRISGSWRRALTVFQAMCEAGHKPGTATYNAVCEACACARLEDAPDVYAAMKYSGIPEFLAYSSAMKTIHGDRVDRLLSKAGIAKDSDVGTAILADPSTASFTRTASTAKLPRLPAQVAKSLFLSPSVLSETLELPSTEDALVM